MSFNPEKFVVPTAKPLPVCLLLDVSSSMSGAKIDSLNQAVSEMLESFAAEEKMETELLVSVITFGNQVELSVPFTKASEIQWKNLPAGGMTPMGTALEMAKAMIEDKDTTPSRAYRPTIVLITDGQPTDKWEQPLENFTSKGRSSKCDRMAMVIGHNTDDSVLRRFVEGTKHDIFRVENAKELHAFFQHVTMSITSRSRSNNPNEIPMTTETNILDKSITIQDIRETDNEDYW